MTTRLRTDRDPPEPGADHHRRPLSGAVGPQDGLEPRSGVLSRPQPHPQRLTWEHFEAVLSTATADGEWLFGRQLMNSLIVALATSAVGIALATTAGYAMSRWGFPGRDAGMRIFLITQMFPGVVMAIPLYILLDELGMLDSLMGLSVVYATTAIPFCTWNMKGYFDTIPVESRRPLAWTAPTGGRPSGTSCFRWHAQRWS